MSQSVNMWWENTKEPRIEPCGTPNVKAFKFDLTCGCEGGS